MIRKHLAVYVPNPASSLLVPVAQVLPLDIQAVRTTPVPPQSFWRPLTETLLAQLT
eukprot:CAMPEP_0113972940 /NCGR_PEP_ID=MMETSP0011_2-20120614/13951_1 /TAXON_ID=101924 /ORGANISM="Rhodosorus marinus" /LENGTH=55 /DNA_ID=CAMNT_0000990363 /DNA_START=651 /DNA_END=815 /DNA_ORIENTATION=- /assembly_acc=CAM_ASM_000156